MSETETETVEYGTEDVATISSAPTAEERRATLEAELEVVALEEKFAELKATEDVDPDSYREAKDQLRAARQKFRAARDGLTIDETGGDASTSPEAVSAKAQEGGQR